MMINGNKQIKEFFNTTELNALYKLKISKNNTLEEVKNKLEIFLEKKGYNTLQDTTNADDKVYFCLLNKIYDLLPIY